MSKIIDAVFQGKDRGQWEVRKEHETTDSTSYKWQCNICGASHLYTSGGKNEGHVPVPLSGQNLAGIPFKDSEIIICESCIKDMNNLL